MSKGTSGKGGGGGNGSGDKSGGNPNWPAKTNDGAKSGSGRGNNPPKGKAN